MGHVSHANVSQLTTKDEEWAREVEVSDGAGAAGVKRGREQIMHAETIRNADYSLCVGRRRRECKLKLSVSQTVKGSTRCSLGR